MPSPIDENKLAQLLTEALLAAAAKIAEPAVAEWSKTLALAIQIQSFEPSRGRLYIPHYWAVYVNDGRDPATPKNTTFFVWWRDPAKDPRFSGPQTPERASQVRRLTRREWRYYSAQRREQIANGEQPDMIVARKVAGVPPKKFFDNDGGMASFLAEANRIGAEIYREYLRDTLGPETFTVVRKTTTMAL